MRQVVDEATKLAKTDAEIGIEELSGDIYADCQEPIIRGILPNTPLTHIAVAQRN